MTSLSGRRRHDDDGCSRSGSLAGEVVGSRRRHERVTINITITTITISYCGVEIDARTDGQDC